MTPEGVRVVLFEGTWVGHVLDRQRGHPELEGHLDVVLVAVSAPDHRERDPRPAREPFSRSTLVLADG